MKSSVLLSSLLRNVLLVLAVAFGSVPNSAAGEPKWSVHEKPGVLELLDAGQPMGEFVFKDSQILRPHFRNLRAPGGLQVTRNQPPIEGQDADDHADMHPGVWLAFGDVSGQDFWRNKASIRHDRFLIAPQAKGDRLTFATQCTMLGSDGQELARQDSQFTLRQVKAGYLLTLDATFTPIADNFYFGDQEEMGLGARVASGITEKGGGLIASSSGDKTAKATWGKAYDWCDYSGQVQKKHVGITLMTHPKNFRPSWWHNRDYGVFVANAFGRKAMNQGDVSRVEVKKGETLRLRYGVLLHASQTAEEVDIPATFQTFQALLTP